MLSYQNFMMIIEDHALLMFLIALSFAFAVGLKSVKAFIIELCLFFGIMLSFSFLGAIAATLFILLSIAQLAFIIFLVYRCKKTIDVDYQLVLEKTHFARRKMTADGSAGTRKTFL